MSDVQLTPQAPSAEQALSSLKRQADRMGVSYKSNVSVATLQKAIKDKMEGSAEASTDEDSVTTKAERMSVEEAKAAATDAYVAEAMKLIRVMITPMEANKAANIDSEIFTAGNSVVGTVTRTIPFGEVWHVEQILLNTIKEKRYQQFTAKKSAFGVPQVTAKLVPAFNVVILPPLTEEERKELADMQLRTRSLDDE